MEDKLTNGFLRKPNLTKPIPKYTDFGFRLTLFGLIQVWVDFEFGSWIAYFGFGLVYVGFGLARQGWVWVWFGQVQVGLGLGYIQVNQVNFGIAFGLALDLI